jgi:flagellar M-ring protein FliF
VQQSLGFNQERGDSVRVINAPFRVEAPPKVETISLHQQPWLHDLLRAAAAALALALVALLVVIVLIRPALTAALDTGKKPVGGQSTWWPTTTPARRCRVRPCRRRWLHRR